LENGGTIIHPHVKKEFMRPKKILDKKPLVVPIGNPMVYYKAARRIMEIFFLISKTF